MWSRLCSQQGFESVANFRVKCGSPICYTLATINNHINYLEGRELHFSVLQCICILSKVHCSVEVYWSHTSLVRLCNEFVLHRLQNDIQKKKRRMFSAKTVLLQCLASSSCRNAAIISTFQLRFISLFFFSPEIDFQ